jgi:hypothetical protein
MAAKSCDEDSKAFMAKIRNRWWRKIDRDGGRAIEKSKVKKL